ncbi:MAG: winged helix-turn-helix transcriptional regulator [Gammaproteobacteria bacterium]|nr:winged helix-turn-helix transcriptional regulator [Gammaproteobacteria bacterium]
MNRSPDKLRVVTPPRKDDSPVPLEMLPYLMNRVTSRANQLWVKTLREHGLTIGRWQVLSVLWRFDGSRIGTIADLSGGEQPAVSRVIDQMERDGLVSRRPSLQDSRAVEVWITGRGRSIYENLLPEADGFVQGMLRNLDNDEIRQLSKLLERIFSDLQ